MSFVHRNAGLLLILFLAVPLSGQRSYEDSLKAHYDEQLLQIRSDYEASLDAKQRALSDARILQQQADREQNTFISRIFFLVIFLLLVIAITLFVAYRSRNRAYKIASMQSAELQAMNNRLQSQTETLNEINSAKDKLFSVISHDLRGPLASLDSCLEILITEDLEEKERNALIEDLRTETHNTLKTLDDLLSWSKIQIGGVVINKTRFDLEELMKEVIDLYGPLAKHKNINIQFNPCRGPCSAFADPYQIRTVVRNLLSNAIKFSPPRSNVTLDLHRKGNSWEVVVADQGKGITPEELTKIKDSTSYYTSRGTNGEKGTGVGLLLSYEFLERHGSTLSFQPNEPVGTRASFTLAEPTSVNPH